MYLYGKFHINEDNLDFKDGLCIRKGNKEIYIQRQNDKFIVSRYDHGILCSTELYGYNTIQFFYTHF